MPFSRRSGPAIRVQFERAVAPLHYVRARLATALPRRPARRSPRPPRRRPALRLRDDVSAPGRRTGLPSPPTGRRRPAPEPGRETPAAAGAGGQVAVLRPLEPVTWVAARSGLTNLSPSPRCERRTSSRRDRGGGDTRVQPETPLAVRRRGGRRRSGHGACARSATAPGWYRGPSWSRPPRARGATSVSGEERTRGPAAARRPSLAVGDGHGGLHARAGHAGIAARSRVSSRRVRRRGLACCPRQEVPFCYADVPTRRLPTWSMRRLGKVVHVVVGP